MFKAVALIVVLAVGLPACGGGGRGGASGIPGLPPVGPTTPPGPVLTPQIVFTSDTSIVLPRAGSSYQFSAAIQNGGNALTWSSSNPSMVTVDATGKATAVASLGSAVITASAPNVDPVSASVTIAEPTQGTVIIPSASVISQTSTQLVLKADSTTAAIGQNTLVVSGDKGGVLAKVTSVQAAAGQVVLQIAPASLPQAFQQIAVDDTGPSQAITVQFVGRSAVMKDRWGRTMRAVSTNGLKCSANGTPIDVSASLGSAVVSAGLQTHRIFRTNGLSVQEFEIATTLTLGIQVTPGSLEVHGALSGSFTCAVKLQSIPVAPIWFGPVIVAVTADVEAGVQGSLSVGGSASIASAQITRTQSVTVGLHYLNGSFQQLASGNPSGSVTLQPWSTTLGVGIHGDVGPFVGVGLGVGVSLGPIQVLDSSFAYANAYGKLKLDVPVSPGPGSPNYLGPSWSAVAGIGAGLEADVSAGRLQPLLDRLHISPVQIHFSGVNVEATLAENPTPTVDVTPTTLTSGAASFSAGVPCNTPVCLNYSGNIVRFIGFKDGGSTEKRLAESRVTNAGSASADWTPAAADNGSYAVAAYLYDGIFGAIGLPYASDPGSKARLRVNIVGGASPGPSTSPTTAPTQAPTSTPTVAPTTSPTAPPTQSPTVPPTQPPTAPPTTSPAGINEYSVGSNVVGIASGPDGAVWFTEANANKIGRIRTDGTGITEFPIPTSQSNPQAITVGPDGALWFTEYGGNKIGRIPTNATPGSGAQIREYDVPTSFSEPIGIATGPDGALWFVEYFGNKVGRITTNGVISEYPIPTSSTSVYSIAAGSDGAMWFTEAGGNKIGRIPTNATPGSSAQIREFPIPVDGKAPYGITSGPDGALWYTMIASSMIGRITTSGTSSMYYVYTFQSYPFAITSAPDGTLWFTEQNGNKIGRMRTDGTITSETLIPTSGSYPNGITVGPDGAIWFAEGIGKVGRLR